MNRQVVWFKRDLRIHDHAPLAQAAKAGPVTAVYVIEPGYWREPDSAARHWGFIRDSLIELHAELAALGVELNILQGDLPSVFAQWHAAQPFTAIHAHEETGNAWTFRRDQAMRQWAKQTGVGLHESPQFGVVRGLNNRDHWAGLWEQRMQAPLIQAPTQITHAPLDWADAPRIAVTDLPQALGVGQHPCPGRQSGGRRAGQAILTSFLHERGEHYRAGMSSPLSGANVCSRLSPAIAYGTLSLREIVHTHRQRWLEAKAKAPRSHWARSLKSFESRLHWHCHFIQKLEDEPALEWRNMHRGYDGLRDEQQIDSERLAAWAEGRTGWPFVDACMRQLINDGWLNFRMRAMLVAVSSYHLWMHWREPAHHLAQLFTDYEPGIHYCQWQMQSGTTGINTLRIYNPIKQSSDQDPDGAYIRRWLPALANLPAEWVHTPWKLPKGLQQQYGVRLGQDYPQPLIDHEQAAREARERIKQHRARHDLSAESARVRRQHASRTPPPNRSQRRAKSVDPRQGQLDL